MLQVDKTFRTILKCMFSKKARKFDEIFPVDLVLTSVPLKKIVTCVGIYSFCLYNEFYGKFLSHIANSSYQKL